MSRQKECYNAIEWCCDELEEQTTPEPWGGRWEGRAIEVDRDGTLNLLRVRANDGGDASIRQVPFDYCPFCGTEIGDAQETS